jgi:hypothetical protein
VPFVYIHFNPRRRELCLQLRLLEFCFGSLPCLTVESFKVSRKPCCLRSVQLVDPWQRWPHKKNLTRRFELSTSEDAMASPRSQQDGVNGRTPSPSVNVDTLPPPDELRQFTRSPHPYHRVSSKLLEPRVECHPPERDTTNSGKARWTRTPRTSSDSGTEADDESNGFLKGLPAPPARARKGLRTTVGIEFDDPSFWLSNTPPWALFVRSPSRGPRRRRSSEESLRDSTSAGELTTRRRRNEVLRRLGETALLLSVGVVGFFRQDVRSLALSWHRGTGSNGPVAFEDYSETDHASQNCEHMPPSSLHSTPFTRFASHFGEVTRESPSRFPFPPASTRLRYYIPH